MTDLAENEKNLFPSQWTKRFQSPDDALSHVNAFWPGEMPLNPNEKEKLLYPSEWTRRFKSSDEALEHMHNIGKDETEKNAKYLKKPNVRYGSGDRQLLDIYYKNEEKGSPIVLFIHGGYWQEFSKECAAFWIEPLMEKGYRAIIAGYDLCPTVSLSELVDEIKCALKYTLQYASDTQASTISLVGHSAGCQLAISCLTDETLALPNSALVKSVILVGGIYDLRLLQNSSVNENNLLKLDDSNIEQLSPILVDYKHLQGRKIKIYVCAAEYDSPVFVENAETLDKHLKEFNIDSEYKLMKGLDHFDIMENFRLNDYELSILLMEQLEQ